AEDGIRDFHVTGVQTCALPIYAGDDFRRPFGGGADLVHAGAVQDGAAHGPGEAVDVQLDAQIPEFQRGAGGGFGQAAGVHDDVRSEERRVGIEAAARGGAVNSM